MRVECNYGFREWRVSDVFAKYSSPVGTEKDAIATLTLTAV